MAVANNYPDNSRLQLLLQASPYGRHGRLLWSGQPDYGDRYLFLRSRAFMIPAPYAPGTHAPPPEVAVQRLLLLRHARAELEGLFCGHADPVLSCEGQSQIGGIIDFLSKAPPSLICSSDLRRAEQTALPIVRHFGVPLRTSAGLREMNFGRWEGLSWKEIEAQFPEGARAWSESFPHHRPPGGESFTEFRARVVGELQKIAAEPTTLVVTHAGFIRTAVAWVLGISDDQLLRIHLDYAGVTTLRKSGESWAVTGLNCRNYIFGAQP